MLAVNADALAVATAKAFSEPTLAPSLVSAYAAAIAQYGCPAVEPALASLPLASQDSLSSIISVGRCSLSGSYKPYSRLSSICSHFWCAAAWAAYAGSPRKKFAKWVLYI